jgi:hypothetical protein
MIGKINRTYVPIFSSFNEEEIELYADYIAEQLTIASMVMTLFEDKGEYDGNF